MNQVLGLQHTAFKGGAAWEGGRRPQSYILAPCAGGRQDAGLLSWLGGVVAEAVRAAGEAEATGVAVAAHRAAIQRAYRLADLQVTEGLRALPDLGCRAGFLRKAGPKQEAGSCCYQAAWLPRHSRAGTGSLIC